MSLSYSKDFFSGKRPWSLIKDEILVHYLPPYLKKVNKLNRKIILVDGFAGPGCFDDGSYGSPYYICKIASQVVPDRFLAILVNKDKSHHQNLTSLLDVYIKNKSSITINGKAQDMLLQLASFVSDETLFIYLDQFGISGFCFNDLLPFLSRNKHNSTELLLNISVPTIHRLSCKRAISSSSIKPLGHRILSQVFGGDYWMDYLFDDKLSPQNQIFGLVEAYKQRLNQYLDYVGYCPIFEKGPKSTLKYLLVFASRHIDAAILLNDIMFKAYWKHIWSCSISGTLFQFEGIDSVLPCNYYSELRLIIFNILKQNKISRMQLWHFFIKNHFMKFSSSDFIKEINKLSKENKILFIDIRSTNRLNDDSILYLNGKNYN